MNAAGTIQAAIDKLTRLRTFSTRGPWKKAGSYIEEAEPPNPDDRFDVLPLNVFKIEESDTDAELVLALHATIDAQLAILRHVLEYYRGDIGIGTNRHVVNLARAILGEQEDT